MKSYKALFLPFKKKFFLLYFALQYCIGFAILFGVNPVPDNILSEKTDIILNFCLFLAFFWPLAHDLFETRFYSGIFFWDVL